MNQNEEETLVAAFRLQESIRKRKLELKRDEEKLGNMFETLRNLKVTRLGKLELRARISTRRQIISERFKAIRPELFLKVAKVNIKDVENILGKEELMQLCEFKNITSWEIISYAKPGDVI